MNKTRFTRCWLDCNLLGSGCRCVTYRSPQPLFPPGDRRRYNNKVRRGEHNSKKHSQQRPHWQQHVSHEGDEHELPHALLGGSGAQRLRRSERQRERAAEQREGEAEEQGQLRDLLELRDLQVLDVGDNEQREEHYAVHRVGALGQGETRTGEQLHQGQGRRGHDEHRQRFEGGRLLQLQVVALEESLQLLAVELVLAGDVAQGCAGWAVTLPPPGLDSFEWHLLHVGAIHEAGTSPSTFRSLSSVGGSNREPVPVHASCAASSRRLRGGGEGGEGGGEDGALRAPYPQVDGCWCVSSEK